MSTPVTSLSPAELQKAARDHLWLHFTRMSSYTRRGHPDHRARRRLLPRGHRTASATSTRSRACSPSRSATASARRSARPRRRRCASCPSTRTGAMRTRARSSSQPRSHPLAPGDLNRVFFVSGGSEAVESAWKLARQYHAARGERRWKAIARSIAYHGTTMGALSINGIAVAADAVRAARARTSLHVRNTNRYHRPAEETEEEFTAFLLEDLEETIDAGRARHGRDGDHGAGAERGRLVHAARGLLRRACARSATATGSCSAPTRSSPASAASGAWFGSERYDIRPDIVTSRQGPLLGATRRSAP